MDYIKDFDIKLVKEMYYAGETVTGHIVLNTIENFKLRTIRVLLKGKAYVEWKHCVNGDRRVVKDNEYLLEERITIWGKDVVEGSIPVLTRGPHQFPFKFQLPESNLPCSFESKFGWIRYFIKVTVDIPYASPPQGIKYFTIIGPFIDCMDVKFLRPLVGHDQRWKCCFCCKRNRISLVSQLDRSAYVCGESIKLKAIINNQGEENAKLKLKLIQYVTYSAARGILGAKKELQSVVFRYKGDTVQPHSLIKWDSNESIVLPTMPPTIAGVSRILRIIYMLKICLELEKSGDALHMNFPITIGTVPFRIPNTNKIPEITYEVASEHVEGGRYIGPEFLLGEVYDGSNENPDSKETVVLYRPVYVTLAKE